jgi:hypothetical protein
MKRRFAWVSLLSLVSLALTALGAVAAAAEPAAVGLPLALLISPSEYQNTIADVFGEDIAIKGRFDPGQRLEGLLAVGARAANISAAGMELYDNLARSIAAQVVESQRRGTLFTCEPRDPKRGDDACARSFLAAAGRLLYRRPLDEQELTARVQTAAHVANEKGDFYAGISTALSQMLIAPEFLYQIKLLEPDPASPGQLRLDSYSRASVLSFYLWDAAPDEVLLTAAAKGELLTTDGLRRQVDRMIESPSVERGVRAFFSDLLGFDEFATLSKDPTFFSEFTPKVLEQAREQTLRTIVNHVITERRDYRDLFTTPETFLTPQLAAVYNVPIADPAVNPEPDDWIAHTYPPGDPRAGILSQISFVALHSPAGRTSPTLRGKALRERVLCENVPPPPGNVDFKFVTDTSNPQYPTTRARLTAHRTEPMCAGCHKLTDPIGLALENFDSAGAYRTTEHGVPIDASGDLSGVKFDGPTGLARAVHDDPAATSCVARRAFAYASGRSPDPQDPEWQRLERQFKDGRYDLLGLMRQVAMSPLLYTVPDQNPAIRAAMSAPGGSK